MKKQLFKRLFSFIVTMFSIYFLNAQCNGNKVRLCKQSRSGGCIYKCVPPNQVQNYFNQGWRYSCTCYYPLGSNNKRHETKSSVTLIDKMQVSKKRKTIDSKKLSWINILSKVKFLERLKVALSHRIINRYCRCKTTTVANLRIMKKIFKDKFRISILIASECFATYYSHIHLQSFISINRRLNFSFESCEHNFNSLIF